MRDPDTEPKKFHIKLRYKVGNSIHYLNYDKFTYHNIRNQNLYQNELETFKKEKNKEIIKPGPGFFTDFKKFLDDKDNVKEKEEFYIPFSRNYITFNNIENFIKDLIKKSPKSNDLDNNKQKFFLTSNHKNITKYFEYLKNNLEENIKYTGPRTHYTKDHKPLIKDNTEIERKKKVIEYAKYILIDEEYTDDENKIYSKIKSNDIQLREIITYHNIFKLLENFYLQEGTILCDKFFQEKYNSHENTNQISLSKKEIYVKIKKINCIKLNKNELYDAFQNNNGIIKPIYELEFEVIPTYSTIAFNINLIDILNPNNILKNTIDNYREAAKARGLQEEKKSIKDMNEYSIIYKKYNNDIFSENKNINTNYKIYIDGRAKYNKLINKFNIIKKKELFKKLDIKNFKDSLLNEHAFNKLITLSEVNIDNAIQTNQVEKNESIDLIVFKYYVDRFFFKKNNHLFINNKVAQIKDVQIRLLNDLDLDNLEKNKMDVPNTITNIQANTPSRNEDFINRDYSKNIRLAIDDVDNSYKIYLDISVIYKDNITDEIPIKDKINYKFDCLGKANTLDTMLSNALGVNYTKNYLQNKLREKNLPAINMTRKIINPITSVPKDNTQTNTQSGGKKNITKKYITKKRNRTLKNLLNYYSII